MREGITMDQFIQAAQDRAEQPEQPRHVKHEVDAELLIKKFF